MFIIMEMWNDFSELSLIVSLILLLNIYFYVVLDIFPGNN